MKPQKPMRHFKYHTLEWRLKAIEVKKRDGDKCNICGNRYNLEVHHKLYITDRQLWDYPKEYLITLCRQCHQSEHAYMDLFRERKIDIRKYLIAGFLAYDLYAKVKAKEWFKFETKR